MEAICDTLVEEIQGQKILLSAENGTLSVRRDLIESHVVSMQLIGQLEGSAGRAGKEDGDRPFLGVVRLRERRLPGEADAGKHAQECAGGINEGSIVTLRFGKSAGSALFEVHNAPAWKRRSSNRCSGRYFSTKGQDRGLGTWSMKLLGEDYLGGTVSFRSIRGRHNVLFAYPPETALERLTRGLSDQPTYPVVQRLLVSRE